MAELPPTISSQLSSDIYQIFTSFSLKEAFGKFRSKYGNYFEFDNDHKKNIITARTGGPGVLKSRMAFGVCGFGKGLFEGHAFIVLRGTQTAPDLISNANLAVSRAANLQSVHDGFNTAFKSEIARYVDKVAETARCRNIHSIHCIGHSLGGALATLAADHIVVNHDLQPYLYTFGAPRIGELGFAEELTRQITAERIFRVYHRTDIVPCIPFFPFIHAPIGVASTSYRLPSPGAFPLSEWHSHKLYVKSVQGKSWKLLQSQTEAHLSKSEIKRWLDKDSPISFSITNLEKLDAAINYVIYLCIKSIGSAGTIAVGGGLTIFDWTARIIREGLKLGDGVSQLVLRLIVRIMQMLGMKPVADKIEATDQFIRHIFTMLHQRLSTYAQKAFDQALNSGRGL